MEYYNLDRKLIYTCCLSAVSKFAKVSPLKPAASMSQQALAVVLVVSCLLAPASAAISSMLAGDAEDDVSACSRRNSELSCLLGCFKCAVAFGRKTYNMGGCCTECHKSGAMLVDDGPEYCSPRFFTDMFASKAHYVNAPSVLSPMANRQARTRTRRYHQS